MKAVVIIALLVVLFFVGQILIDLIFSNKSQAKNLEELEEIKRIKKHNLFRAFFWVMLSCTFIWYVLYIIFVR